MNRIDEYKEGNMNIEALRRAWKQEEESAHIHGWDFSHIDGRYAEEAGLPWDYDRVVRGYLKPEDKLLDYDTGGGEYLLSLRHPCQHTSATEGYPPNVRLCQQRLIPLGIDLRECADPSRVPFPDEAFDIMINRHGGYDPREVKRLLRSGGVFITEQVGGENDRDLVKLVLPEVAPPYPHLTLPRQSQAFRDAGFDILQEDEAFRPIVFFDVGAFVWFAHIIEWEFPGFSVDRCFEQLLSMQRTLEERGRIEGTIHRFLIVARKMA